MAIIALALVIVVHHLGHRAVAAAFKLEVDPALHGCCLPRAEARFAEAAPGKRLALAAAGPLASYLLAVVPLWLVLLQGSTAPTLAIESVAPGLPAEQAGLRPGDSIAAVGGAPVSEFREVAEAVAAAPGAVKLSVRREGQAVEVELQPQPGPDGRRVVGILPRKEHRSPGAAEAFAQAHRVPLELAERLVAPSLETVGGPVAMVKHGSVPEGDLGPALGRAWASSLALYSGIFGLLQLLPLPGLDGWLVLLGLRELATRKKPDYAAHAAARGKAVWVFGLVAVLFFLLVLKNDLTRLAR